MIYHVATSTNDWTWQAFLRSWGRPLKSRTQTLQLHHLANLKELPVGTYIFTDHEMLTRPQREVLAQVWEQLEADGRSRLLNHPLKVLGRFDLLSLLHRQGINDYRVFRPDGVPPDLRFPAFLRFENDHLGSRTPLLQNWNELEESIVRAALGGARNEDLMVVEFCDTIGSDGLFRKYGAFGIDGEIVPPLIDHKGEWMVKGGNLAEPDSYEEEWEALQKNPDSAKLATIFALAGIDFGRMDYSFQSTRLQVWEINTNPQLSMSPDEYKPRYTRCVDAYTGHLLRIFERLDTASAGMVPISLKPPASQSRRDLAEDCLLVGEKL